MGCSETMRCPPLLTFSVLGRICVSAWKEERNSEKGARMGAFLGKGPAAELAFISKVSGYLIAVPHTQDLQSETQV